MYNNRLFKHADIFCADYECPKNFTYWALLQAVSITNANRASIQVGADTIPLNLYTILCGTPSVKGYKAIQLTRMLLDGINYQEYLPDNLGLRKTSGMLVAMLRKSNGDSIEEEDVSSLQLTPTSSSGKNKRDIDAFFGNSGSSFSMTGSTATSSQAKSYVSSDFVSFCSGAQTDFYGLLIQFWHCKGYSLSSSKGMLKVENPYLNVFTSMTQIGLMDAFPDNYTGLNALSTFIIDFEEEPRKKCPYPAKMDMTVYCDIQNALAFVEKNENQLTLDADAKIAGAEFYGNQNLEEDSRLLPYAELRHTHLHRIAGCLALYEHRFTITRADIEDANTLLSSVEEHLSDALGEFGNSKISAGRQKCMELIRREEVIRKSVYRARCASFLYSKDFEIFLTDMLVQKKIIEEWNQELQDYMLAYNPNYRKKSQSAAITEENISDA